MREDWKVRVQQGELGQRNLLTSSEALVQMNKFAPSRVPSDAKVDHKVDHKEESMEDCIYSYLPLLYFCNQVSGGGSGASVSQQDKQLGRTGHRGKE